MIKLTIDLGGTSLRVARLSDGRVIQIKKESCPAQSDEDTVIAHLENIIQSMMSPDVGMIGIGVPSVVDAERGIVYDVANIPSWKEVHLKDILESRFRVPVKVDNDVNCFVLGEKFFGAGKPFDNLVGITLGTGVGAGIIIDGCLYRGANTGAGEVGSLPYLDSDYEHYCSGMFLKRCSNLTGEQLAVAASAGDSDALDIWRRLGYNVGKLIQALMFTYDPQAIIIGGGIAGAAVYFEPAMRQSVQDGFPYRQSVKNIRILFSCLDGCNLLGASML